MGRRLMNFRTRLAARRANNAWWPVFLGGVGCGGREFLSCSPLYGAVQSTEYSAWIPDWRAIGVVWQQVHGAILYAVALFRSKRCEAIYFLGSIGD